MKSFRSVILAVIIGGPVKQSIQRNSIENRLSHAILQRNVRLPKARKIESILREAVSLTGVQILDVGAGGGYVAEHFVSVVGPGGRVAAVDQLNQLPPDSQVSFYPVTDGKFPFEDDLFDVAISNHVLAHVGTRRDQIAHMKEIARVVKPGGVIYLATPNRWAIFEPNFRLPFLSWFPPSTRSQIVRMTGRGDQYDCEPVSRPNLRTLVEEAGLMIRDDATGAALRMYGQVESAGLIGKIFASFPPGLARLVGSLWIIPSFIFLLEPAGTSKTSATRSS
jgi:SAM-dependent methyltransferase